MATTIERPPIVVVPREPAARPTAPSRRPPTVRPRPVGPRANFRLTHLDALDGLRGVAVAGVLLFHGGHLHGRLPRRRPLLRPLRVPDHARCSSPSGASTGTIASGAFWARRARRLLPALLARAGRRRRSTRVVFADPTRARTASAATRSPRSSTSPTGASIVSRPGLLGPVPRAVAARAHVEPRHRGAVLPRLAAAARRRCCGWRRGSRRAVLVRVASRSRSLASIADGVVSRPRRSTRAYLGTDTRVRGAPARRRAGGVARSGRARCARQPVADRLEVRASSASLVLLRRVGSTARAAAPLLYRGGFFAVRRSRRRRARRRAPIRRRARSARAPVGPPAALARAHQLRPLPVALAGDRGARPRSGRGRRPRPAVVQLAVSLALATGVVRAARAADPAARPRRLALAAPRAASSGWWPSPFSWGPQAARSTRRTRWGVATSTSHGWPSGSASPWRFGIPS